MGTMNVLVFLLLGMQLIWASKTEPGSVTVEFGILEPITVEDTTSANALANRIWNGFQNEDLDVGYDISFLNITFTNDTSITASADNSSMGNKLITSSFSVVLALILSLFMFTEYTFESRKQGLALFAILLISCNSVIIPVSASLLSSKYQNCMVLLDEVDYRLYWNVTGSSINFGIEIDSTGWVALGLSGNGYMNSGGLSPGSDIVLAFQNGSVPGCENGCIHDYSTVVYNLPILDVTQDVQLNSYLEAGEKTYVEFTRLLDTQDTEADRVIDPSQPQYVIFSTQSTVKPINYTLFQKHDFKGSRSITFNQPSACPEEKVIKVAMKLAVNPVDFQLDHFLSAMSQSLQTESGRFSIINIINQDPNLCPECQYLDMRIPDHTIPTDTTTYTCVGFTFPVDKEYHAVRFEPIVNNSQVLHHMVLYKSSIDYTNRGLFGCASMPGSTYPMYAWGPGSGAFDVPSNTGFPIGVGTSSYAVLQFHYNNPTHLEGLVDSSGFRIFYTSELRKYNAGFLWLGMPTEQISIPKGHSTWHQQAECTKTAVSFALATLGSDLNIFAYGMHMHYYGKQLWTEHYRNGEFLGYLGEERAYDFNDQHIVSINASIKTGDNLVSHCIWDSSSAPGTVSGGESTADEMCLQAILYYPLIDGVPGCQMNPTVGCDWGVNCP